jgi:hypothetical protein
MNNLFSNLLKPLNALIGIGIIFYFTILGAYGPTAFLTTIQFFQTFDPSVFESLPSRPSAWGAVMGFLRGLIVASFACGLISTILLIKEHLDQIRKTLKSVNQKI